MSEFLFGVASVEVTRPDRTEIRTQGRLPIRAKYYPRRRSAASLIRHQSYNFKSAQVSIMHFLSELAILTPCRSSGRSYHLRSQHVYLMHAYEASVYVREPTEPLSQIDGPGAMHRKFIDELVCPVRHKWLKFFHTGNAERTIPWLAPA